MSGYDDFIKITEEKNVPTIITIKENEIKKFQKFNSILILVNETNQNFDINKFIDFQGEVFKGSELKPVSDVDILGKFQKETGIPIYYLKYGNSKETIIMNEFLKAHDIIDTPEEFFIWNNTFRPNKDNVIFNIQRDEIDNIKLINDYIKLGNYDNQKIHIIWVLDDKNKLNTIITKINKYFEFIDGEIWITQPTINNMVRIKKINEKIADVKEVKKWMKFEL